MYVAIYTVAKVYMKPESQLLQAVATFHHHMLTNANGFGSNLDYLYRKLYLPIQVQHALIHSSSNH